MTNTPATNTAQPQPPGSEQITAAALGLLTGGPLGALSAWGWFRFLKGKWGPWALVGLLAAPACVAIQIGVLAAIGTAASNTPKPLPPATRAQ